MHFRKNVNPMLEKLGASSTVFFKSKNEFDSLSRRNSIIPSAYNSKIKFIDEIVSNKTQKVKPSEHDKKVKFSVKQPIEQTKDLIAIHNTTEGKLLNALELGGLPSTSITIMKAENTRGNNDFGKISSKIISNKLLDICIL